jgi:hypothetical protein
MDIIASHKSSSESCNHFLPLCREKTHFSDANQVDTAAKPKELNAVKTVVIVDTMGFWGRKGERWVWILLTKEERGPPAEMNMQTVRVRLRSRPLRAQGRRGVNALSRSGPTKGLDGPVNDWFNLLEKGREVYVSWIVLHGLLPRQTEKTVDGGGDAEHHWSEPEAIHGILEWRAMAAEGKLHRGRSDGREECRHGRQIEEVGGTVLLGESDGWDACMEKKNLGWQEWNNRGLWTWQTDLDKYRKRGGDGLNVFAYLWHKIMEIALDRRIPELACVNVSTEYDDHAGNSPSYAFKQDAQY